jgi:hypothetical protein
MPLLDPTIQTKINNLRLASRDWTNQISVFEVLKINWESGVKYYGKTYIPLDMIDDGIEVFPLLHGEDFLTIEQDSSLSDGEVSVEIWDGGQYNEETEAHEGAGEFADLVHDEGEGIPCEIFLWFPLETLFLSVWQGHLRSEENADAFIWKGKIGNGFRSPNLEAPSRAHYDSCDAIFGGRLETQQQIDEGGCPYNDHIGGDIGVPGFTDCPRRSTDDCVTRGVDPLFHLSHATAEITVLNNQTKGPQLYSISRGNESNLKEAVRVVMGTRKIRDCQVLAFRRDYNNNDPENGWFAAIYEVCEGPISAIYGAVINGQNANPLHYNYRLGTLGQTPVGSDLTSHGYSATALIRYNFGWVDPATVGPDSMRAEAFVIGLNDIRQFLDADTFVEGYTSNRVWQIARIFCDKRWGLGNDYARLNIESWINAAEWCDEVVTFTEEVGGETFTWNHTRSTSNVELVGRSAQQQIEDMCRYGRLSRPFLFQNEICIEPVRPATEEELEDAPLFTDKNVPGRNIIVDQDGRSTLTRSTKSDLDIPNRIEATFNDASQDFKEIPLDPVEDVDQQEKAGRVQGDSSRRRVTKKHSLLGITTKSEAIKIAYWLLWFGEFGEGGIKNNLTISFKAFILDTLTLHENKVIKVESDQLERYGFEYFRITKLKRDSNLHVTIEVAAYNHEEETNFETELEAPEPEDLGGGGYFDPEIIRFPGKITFDEINWADGVLRIDLLEV